MSAAEGWGELLTRLEPYVSPEWTKNAQEHGDQPWIRLILLVDAHHQLSTPRVAEKVAMSFLSAVKAAEANESIELGPGIGPSVSQSVLM